MTTSGTLRYDRDEHRYCSQCELGNDVSVQYDHEDYSATWTCPNCDWEEWDTFDDASY